MARPKKTTGETKGRGSLYLPQEAVWKLKYIALMSEKTQTAIIEEALSEYFAKWERKNGEVPTQKS